MCRAYWQLGLPSRRRRGARERGRLRRGAAGAAGRRHPDPPARGRAGRRVPERRLDSTRDHRARQERSPRSRCETFSVTLRRSRVRRERLSAAKWSRYLGTRSRAGALHAWPTSAACSRTSSGTPSDPILRTAPAPLFLLSRLVRDSGYKVVLTGEGADEVLGGYDIFKEAKVRRFWARATRSRRWRPLLLQRLYPYLTSIQAQPRRVPARRSSTRRAGRRRPVLLAPAAMGADRAAQGAFLRRRAAELGGLRRARGARGIAARRRFARLGPALARRSTSKTPILLPGYILSSQGDRMAMAHSVEGAFPVPRPPRRGVRGAAAAAAEDEGAEREVPPEALRAGLRARVGRGSDPKQPYRAPDARSFFDAGRACEYVEELLSPGRSREHGMFNPAAVEKLVAEVRKGGRVAGDQDNMALVGVLSTQLSVDQFVRGSAGGART